MHLATSTVKRMYEFCSLFPMPPKALIVCFPKSASTFLMNMLCKVADMEQGEMILSHERNEQDFFLPRMADHYFKRVAYRLHARATDSNVQFLRTIGVQPVVLTRNIFDVICSFRDHSVNMSLKHSMAYLPESFLDMDKSRQYDMVIDMAVPWYFYFYVSWCEAQRRGEVSPMWLTFEDMIADKAGTTARVCDFYGLPHTPQKIEKALDELDSKRARRNTHMNKGVAGRGQTELTDEQRARVQRMADYYPGIDFGHMGL